MIPITSGRVKDNTRPPESVIDAGILLFDVTVSAMAEPIVYAHKVP
jgi:hypothetical protein